MRWQPSPGAAILKGVKKGGVFSRSWFLLFFLFFICVVWRKMERNDWYWKNKITRWDQNSFDKMLNPPRDSYSPLGHNIKVYKLWFENSNRMCFVCLVGEMFLVHFWYFFPPGRREIYWYYIPVMDWGISPQIHVGALILGVTVFGDKFLREANKFKWSHKGKL